MATQILGKSCSFGLPYIIFVLCLLVSKVGSHFGEGRTLVLIVSVSGHCLPFTYHDLLLRYNAD